VHLLDNKSILIEYLGTGGKLRPTCRADNSAVLVVSNVTVRMEAQCSIPPLKLQDLLRESITLSVN